MITTEQFKSFDDALHFSPLLKEIQEVTERFYSNNEYFTELLTPTPINMGFGWEEGVEQPKRGTETIIKEMEALLPIAEFDVAQFSRTKEQVGKSIKFKIGIVYAADPHTYMAPPAQQVVDSYRTAFWEYLHFLPISESQLRETIVEFPNGLPKGRLATYLPLHSIVWCFMEVDGKIQPIDAMTLMTGGGFLKGLFHSEDPTEQQFLEKEKHRLQLSLLTTMSEYSHVAAVALYHLYEEYFMSVFIDTINRHRAEFHISEQWSEYELRKNFSLFRKGIRRHMNIGYDPAEPEVGEWFSLIDGARTDIDAGRGPASQPSAHIFLREISFKKWIRLFTKFLDEQSSEQQFGSEEYQQLDQLVRLALLEADAWSPDGEVGRLSETHGVEDLREERHLFGHIHRSKFLAENPARFIKALDPYANWEGPAILDLLYEPLIKGLSEYQIYDVENVEEQADAMVPYHRNISAITMKFPIDKQPGEILTSLGGILSEVTRAKIAFFRPENDLGEPYVFLSAEKIAVWHGKLSNYRQTRKMVDPLKKSEYQLNAPIQDVMAILEDWSEVDQINLFKQFLAQILLYVWQDIQESDFNWESMGNIDELLDRLFSADLEMSHPKITQIWVLMRAIFSYRGGILQLSASKAFSRVLHHTASAGKLDEQKLANYIVVKTLENEQLGIRPEGQRPLNSTRLPGFLASFDYIHEQSNYLQVTLSPIISERGSMEQIKGLVLERFFDKPLRM
ncbi:MAG TPA: hypothetical protein PKJ26_01865 [Candidatus Woesebacteria bacterium]|jgi:hypothetical protein|nr:hypothetical protein [Candidatus Woesebacteria bacterium]HNS65223.1 hypothetical protein [Candidatus Woesebacteria bacterium]